MNKRLIWILLTAFVLANVLAGIKVARRYQSTTDTDNQSSPTPVAAPDFPSPVDLPPAATVTKQDIAKIVCPKPLSAADWRTAIVTDSPAAIDWSGYQLSDSERQAINQSYQRQAVNLAGHFHLASWSCGHDCHNAAIINIKNGRIIALGLDDDLQTKYGWQFSATSSLLTINPDSQDSSEPTIYALVEDSGLRRICYLAQ
jgi:hypothetical protein